MSNETDDEALTQFALLPFLFKESVTCRAPSWTILSDARP